MSDQNVIKVQEKETQDYQKMPDVLGQTWLGRFFGSRKFLKLLVSIAIPVAVQNLITSTINMLDTMMISPLGSDAIAAVGQVNQFVFFFQVVLFGINNGGSIFYAQYYGRRDQKGIDSVLAICMRLSLGVALLFTLASLLAGTSIMQVLAPEPALVRIGKEYLSIIALSFVAMAVTLVLGSALRSVGQANIGMRASLLAFVLNVVLNYILIFGKLGFPVLGVRGAAIATLIARLAEMLWVLSVVMRKKAIVRFHPRSLLDFDGALSRQYLKLASPVIVTEALWSLSQLVYALVYVRIGTDAAAGIQLSATIQNVLFILTLSLAAASAVVIGNAIGGSEDKENVIFPTAKRILRITLLSGFICSAISILAPDFLLLVYSGLTPDLHFVASNLVRLRGAFLIIRFLNSVLILGILRAGGDVRVPMLVELSTIWLFSVPMAFVAGLVLDLGIYWTLALITSEEIIKYAILFLRYRKKRWIHEV